jgi:hypothetical protein
LSDRAANRSLQQEGCLNCGTPLQGAFCSACGQRAIPAYPSMREMVGDAWHELSGYDGRFVRTFRLLLRRPGALTIETLEGRRARYVSPVRIYLIASLIYFLVAAASPMVRSPGRVNLPGQDKLTIELSGAGLESLTPEMRQQARAQIDRAPRLLRPIILAALENPERFRGGILERLPRVLFVLVPVFAVILSLVFRGRAFSQHLILALHVHAYAFLALVPRELARFTGSLSILTTFEALAQLVIAVATLIAFRRVYREGWLRIVVKSIAVGFLYLLAGILGLVVVVVWTAFA